MTDSPRKRPERAGKEDLRVVSFSLSLDDGLLSKKKEIKNVSPLSPPAQRPRPARISLLSHPYLRAGGREDHDEEGLDGRHCCEVEEGWRDFWKMEEEEEGISSELQTAKKKRFRRTRRLSHSSIARLQRPLSARSLAVNTARAARPRSNARSEREEKARDVPEEGAIEVGKGAVGGRRRKK